MNRPLDHDLLCRQWLHSSEEDTASVVVYRPVGFPLPPSRGRSGWEFQCDGALKRLGIGPTDTSAVEDGEWTIEDPQSGEIHVRLEGETRVLKVEDLQPDRMTVRRDKS